MANTKIPVELSSTPGIVDGSNATAITIDSNEKIIIGDTASHVDDLLQIETPASGGGHGIQIRRNDTNTDQFIGSLTFGNNSDTDIVGIFAKTDGASDSGALLLATQGSGGSSTERMRIDSSGNIGIGTSSPNGKLTISNSGAGGFEFTPDTTAFSVANSNYIASYDRSASAYRDIVFDLGGAENQSIRFKAGGNVGIGTSSPSSYYSKELVVAVSDNGGITIVNSDTSHAAYLMFADGTSGADAYRGQIGYDHNNNSMFFSTDSTLRLTIDSSGKVFIGLTAQINSSMLSVGDGGVGITYSGAPANYYRQIYQSSSGNLFFYNGSNQGYIDQAGAFNDASDERIKKDIEDISYGLDTVKALKPRKYKMKLNDDEQIGFIAQEVESLVPEIVNTGETPDGEEQKGMSYGHLTAVLTKAIQEQQELIETQQTTINDLKSRIETLEG